MATSKFHLLLFCCLLYSETHSSEAQACWDSDKFYHLWLVTSTRLDYFNINSLPNLIPINYIFTRPWHGSDVGDSLCWTPDVASPLGSNTCLRVRFPSPSSRTSFSYFSLTRGKRALKPLRWMNSFPFWWDYVQENSSLPKFSTDGWNQNWFPHPPSWQGCQPVSQQKEY